jgi:hypothetical protein
MLDYGAGRLILTTQSQDKTPPGWEGSLPEYVAYRAFERAGKVPGTDFTYQSPLQGGRMEKGGQVLDFLFYDPPDLAVNIQGVYYHYQFGVESGARDKIAREQMLGAGITVIFIDEDDIMEDPDYYAREALNYRDHSRLGPGGS